MFLSRIFKQLHRWISIKNTPVEYARRIGVDIGEDCRILGMNAGTFGSEPFLVKIGSHVTITSGVRFVTHDGGVWIFRDEYPDIEIFGKIEVGNNSFIGLNSIILPGVTIGDNCIIGAGSLVNKDIPSNSVAAGVPAKVISSSDQYREKAIAKSTNIRSMDWERKKEYLISHFTSGKREANL